MSLRMLTLSLVTGVAMSAQAAILSVDFGLTGAPTQTGFSAFTRGSNIGTAVAQSQAYAVTGVSSGSLQVDVFLQAADGCGRDRGGSVVSGPYANLYRDLFTRVAEASSATPTTVTDSVRITGLDANTSYVVDIWSLDRGFNNGSIFSWWNVTTGSPVLIGTITNDASAGTLALADDKSFRLTQTLQADALGQIRLMHYDSAGTGTLNALQIGAVPEPTSLAALGCVTVLTLRRRRA